VARLNTPRNHYLSALRAFRHGAVLTMLGAKPRYAFDAITTAGASPTWIFNSRPKKKRFG
jgi:hypothetical protein